MKNSEEESNQERSEWGQRRLMKNVLVVCFSFFLLFTAYQALQSLQSSINCDAGLGLASLSTVYVTLIFSAMFTPALIINRIGLKWSLACSMSCYVLYTAANYYPNWATLIPASALVGLAAAPLWTAKATYLTTAGMRYSRLTGETKEAVINRFFGIFFFLFQSGLVFGNLISSLVLQQDNSEPSELFTCGAQDCYTETGDENSTSYCDPPEKSLRFTLISIYLASGIAAILVIIFLLESIRTVDDGTNKTACGLFLATTNLLKDNRQILLIPLTIFSGLEQAFIAGDFTKSYVTCTIGVGWVGYVMICYGLTDAVFSLLWGVAAKRIGRFAIFLFGGLMFIILFVFLLLWVPTRDQRWMYFITAAIWGMIDAIWQTQINALYGSLFPEKQEAAFSNYRLWESLGFAIAFAYSNFLCVWTKLLILVCVCGIGMCGYVTVEVHEKRRGRSTAQRITEESTKI